MRDNLKRRETDRSFCAPQPRVQRPEHSNDMALTIRLKSSKGASAAITPRRLIHSHFHLRLRGRFCPARSILRISKGRADVVAPAIVEAVGAWFDFQNLRIMVYGVKSQGWEMSATGQEQTACSSKGLPSCSLPCFDQLDHAIDRFCSGTFWVYFKTTG